VNTDRFSAIILKQRTLAYPAGRELAGVKYERQRDLSFEVGLHYLLTSFMLIIIGLHS
jgi:hypothetical protein